MDNRPYPKLKNQDTGSVIEVNANPFSIGRGLSCNYVLQNKAVSRVHCILEKDDENNWIFRDTGTNGTYFNQELVRKDKSPLLKNNDVISLDNTGLESYIFYINEIHDDLTDEQLCAIADSVLNEVEYFSSNPIVVPNSSRANPTNEPLGGRSVSLRRNATDSASSDPLQDHPYMAKSSEKAPKRPRMTRSPRPVSEPLPTSQDTVSNNPRVTTIAGTISESAVSSVPGTGNFSADVPQSGGLGVADGGVQATPSSANVGDGGGNSERSDGVRSESQTSDSSNRTVCRDDTEVVVPLAESGSSGSRPTEGVPVVEPGPSKSKKGKRPKKSPVEEQKAEPKVPDKEMQDHYEVMENELQCVICSELFIKALTLNCSHTFCKYCITMWSKNKSDCPICRTRIISTTSTIVLDNVIEKMIENSNEEIKQQRQILLEERKKQEQAENEPPAADRAQTRATARRGRGARGRGGTSRRGRGGNRTQQDAPRINVLDPVAINIGALVNNVIDVSSDSEWSSDTDSMSPNDLDEYDNDDWYDRRRPYYGGYGYCFRCGSPSHWANNCPNR